MVSERQRFPLTEVTTSQHRKRTFRKEKSDDDLLALRPNKRQNERNNLKRLTGKVNSCPAKNGKST